MRNLVQFMTKKSLREELLRAESEARLRGPNQSADDLERQFHGAVASSMTEEDEARYRRIMAMLHYAEDSAIPEYEALLTEGEREYLDSYVTYQRWANLRVPHRQRKSGNRESASREAHRDGE